MNVVSPGLTDTAMMAATTDEVRAALVGRIPLGRMARPEEVAAQRCSSSARKRASSRALNSVLMAGCGRSDPLRDSGGQALTRPSVARRPAAFRPARPRRCQGGLSASRQPGKAWKEPERAPSCLDMLAGNGSLAVQRELYGRERRAANRCRERRSYPTRLRAW
ncbi:hypothetical protein [Pararoseomonas sp. SCSIO 73927]|uniref:hypothetical protein n=1 Tax=Pararoseomonas sp. SCSIO 73927 TaxID=3114537 RepID=UPI0038D1FD31